MPHTYTKLLVHCVFSTKERRDLIPQQIQPDLWAYIGGIARTNGFVAIAVGGTDNHAHVLLGIPANMPVAKAVQLIKAGSSKWPREQKGLRLFAWQEAYGEFTIGASQIAKTVSYIRNQAVHHINRPFETEYRALLQAYDVAHEVRLSEHKREGV
jgi:REP element-mobilizing transposase RayT